MKAYNRMLAAVIAAAALIFAGVNIWLANMGEIEGRPHRVDAARAAAAIEAAGIDGLDLSAYPTLVAVVPVSADSAGQLAGGNCDYLIREINDQLYRFDYTTVSQTDRRPVIAINVALGVMSIAVLAVMLYLRRRVIKPFSVLSDMPYELSKGNLTAPVKAERSRFFARFEWGMDMLRQRLEKHRSNELSLQSERKKLILSLSHDVRIPLSAIKLYARALTGKLYDSEEKQLEVAGKISEKADELESLVSRIVTASREDFLSLEVEMGEFYLSALMNTVTAYYSDKLELLRIGFLVGEYRDCLIGGDPDRSVEVLQNIMENAIKYGDGREITVSVSEEDGCRLVSVSNSGCTLNPEELPHIFDSFWRGQNASGCEGSGLGLYICRCLMNKMGGEVFAAVSGDVMTVTAVFCPV